MIIKWIAESYIKRACAKACDSNASEYRHIQTLLFNTIRECDTESNDSTIYAWMLGHFIETSNIILPHVSKGLRK